MGTYLWESFSFTNMTYIQRGTYKILQEGFRGLSQVHSFLTWAHCCLEYFLILISLLNSSDLNVRVYSASQSCPDLCNLLDCSPPGSSVHGISQARILEGVAISYYRGIFLTPGVKPMSLVSPVLAGDSLPLCHLGHPQV